MSDKSKIDNAERKTLMDTLKKTIPWAKKGWFLLLLLLSSIYVFVYRYRIWQLDELNAAHIVFFLWLILLLSPLFSELEMFGIKLKREVEKVKTEVKDGMSELKLSIKELAISNAASASVYVNNSTVTPIDILRKMFPDLITPTAEVSVDDQLNVPEQSVFLFKIRLTLEKSIYELAEKIDYVGGRNIYKVLKHLIYRELLNGRTVDLITEIIKIANRGVHGETVSNEYIDFIKDVFPQVQAKLDEANSRFTYYT